jgi:hypothetical protein
MQHMQPTDSFTYEESDGNKILKDGAIENVENFIYLESLLQIN